jgi:peptide/nickel transport system substrate-binding protein
VIDAAGPWGSGPFTLVEGYSSIDDERATIRQDPLAATWLIRREDRTPRVRLVANPDYWDTSRGPHLEEVIFRNDVSPAQALEWVCTTDGEVDILTEVAPAAAARVETSEYARLVAIDAIRTVVGVINRHAEGLPFADTRARQALNLAVDRDALVREALFGRAVPLAGLTPASAVSWLHRLSPYRHDPARAAKLWEEAGGGGGRTRPLRIAAWGATEPVARRVAADLRGTLGVEAEVAVVRGADEIDARRRLAEKDRPQDWDILILQQGAQAADAPPLEQHRAFVGETGEFRAGPVVPKFEALYEELVRQTSSAGLAEISRRIDHFVYREALALFLCAPQALYAVNRHVDFTPYRTTFELAECRVDRGHWSRR